MPNLPSAFLNWGSGRGLSSKILGGFCFDKTFMHLIIQMIQSLCIPLFYMYSSKHNNIGTLETVFSNSL